jgi:pSer/pThr/pTyr-binding forkhead associated (FHA) protein
MAMFGNNLGLMKPVGGGDPVPLRKPELTVGRRASCDVVLDFENISGKHCVLRFHNQVWHVRDLGSTNGTTVNGAPISSEHTVMPDDELGVAHHIYRIDYEPGAPEAVLSKGDIVGDDDILDSRKKTSLMELAGLDTDGATTAKRRRPTKAPETILRLSAEEGEFEDALPEHVKAVKPKPAVETTDDDFLKLIEDDVKKP